MYNLNVYKTSPNPAILNTLPIKREWMEKTFDKHAYNCFPVTLSNGLGLGISYPKDIVFVWDGVSDSSGHHVKILEGSEYVYTERANGTISFKTGIIITTEENVSVLHMPVPNMFINGITPFTTLISTSFYRAEFPAAAKITKSYEKIIIKANTPVIALLPISLSEINNSNIKFHDSIPNNFFNLTPEYAQHVSKLNNEGKWSNFYRNATDHLGNKIGNHEIKSIRFNLIKDNNE
jgi:hypothetical protein